MGNIVGLDLNVDENFISNAVNNAVIAGIAEALSDKEGMVNSFVSAVLTQKVDRDGRPSSYSRDTTTLLEYHVKKILNGEVHECIKEVIEERKPGIKAAIKKAFEDEATQDNLVASFLESLTRTLTADWNTNVSFEWKERSDY